MKQSVWYCTKFDEIWLIEPVANKYMRLCFIANTQPDGSAGEWWEALMWPRPRDGFPFVFIGYL